MAKYSSKQFSTFDLDYFDFFVSQQSDNKHFQLPFRLRKHPRLPDETMLL